MPRLNGWRRLWVLLSVLWCFWIGGKAYVDLPTEENIFKTWSDELLTMAVAVDPYLHDVPVADLRSRYADLTAQELVAALIESYSDRPDDLHSIAFSEDRPPGSSSHSDAELIELLDSGDYMQELNPDGEEVIELGSGIFIMRGGRVQPPDEDDPLFELGRLYKLKDWIEKRDDAPTVEQLDEEYSQRLRTLSDERGEALASAIWAWSIPMALLYAIGRAIAWVRRGFSKGARS